MNETATILVLEDDDEMRDMLSEVLRDHGYTVVAVARGDEAVVQVSQQPFDLIVADIRMDGMDGLEVLERTRQQQPSIGTLVVSGYATEAETARANRISVGGYLKKPFRMGQFLELVREQLRGKHDVERSRQQNTSRRVVLLWALEGMAKMADDAGLVSPSGTIARMGSLAAALGRTVQLSEPVCQEIRVGTMIAALETVPQARPPRILLDDAELLPAFSSCFRANTLEWKIARLCRLAAAEDSMPAAEELSRRHAGELDAEVLELYERARLTFLEPRSGAAPEVVTGLWNPGRKSRSLLALGKALERAGDLKSAFRAYGQVLSSAPTGRQAVQALLHQASVSLASGEINRAAELAGAAPRRATGLGPLPRAEALLEAGLLLLKLKDVRAADMLAEAALQLKELGLEAAHAKAVAGLAAAGRAEADLGSAVETLLRASHAADFLSACDWLLPLVVEQAGARNQKAWLLRLLGAFPGELAEGLRQGRIGREGREALLGVLEDEGPRLGEELREVLVRDADPALRGRATALEAQEQNAAPPSFLRVVTFGYFEVYRGSDLIDDKQWKTQKTKYLFAFLASRWGTSFSEDKILDEFWPDDREKGKKNLYWSTSVARRCLRGPDGKTAEVLLRERGQLTLNPEVAHWQDLEEFTRAFEDGQRALGDGKPREALAFWRRLGTLYQGPYLEGCYLDWAVRLRSVTERQAAEGLCGLARLLLDVEEYQEALEAARQAVEIHPHRQEAHLLMMRALLGLGRPEAAIEQFRECESFLRREYDMEPITELLEYYHRARLGLT
ncbi:MAG: response regulator [Vulcanimicrobiota bacterium]